MQLNNFPYDFHMHTCFSDGSLTPEALMDLSHECGITHLAVTDHDTLHGVAQAEARAQWHGMAFTPGVEISADWQGKVIHVLGLDVDVRSQPLNALLAATQTVRRERIQAIVAKLKRRRIALPEDCFPEQEGVSYGRMHVAMALVKQGVVGKAGSAFKQYLAQGCSAYVPTKWPSLAHVVEVILAAGGIPVIAHPRRYKISYRRLMDLVAEFHGLGGRGLELGTASQSPDDQRLIYALVQQFDLLMSQGSDFHHPGGYIQPGKVCGVPDGSYVWDQFKPIVQRP